jgi:GDP-L-fucose synthase
MAVSGKDLIAITGGDGFVGGFLREKLRQAGYDNQFIVRLEDFDLTREPDVERLYRQVKPDVVIHLAAAVGGIGANRENPGRFFYINLAMGLHLIEHARRVGLKRFVQVGTVCAYPKYAPVPFKEEDLWNGYPEETNAPYGIAKKALLVMCQSYRRQYGMDAVYVLPVNMYGPRDNFNLGASHVIPALVRKCVAARDRGDQEIVAWGTGSASREFLYVEDCADALVQVMSRYDSPEPLNIGTGQEITIKDLTELIAKLVGFEGRIVWDPSKPDGQPRRCLDVSRIAAALGWRATTPLEAGLRKTIDWFQSHRDSFTDRVA